MDTIAVTQLNQETTTPAIKVGISACLLGQPVRYNGGHSQSRLCLNTLADHFEFQGFCPEVAMGLGVPRPVLRLVGQPQRPRMVFSDQPQQDLTDRFIEVVSPVVEEFGLLDGYILMKNSPSCGLERVKVYQENGYPHGERGMGLFAAALTRRYPNLPVEEEGRLHDARLRENFILRVFAHHRFRQQVDQNLCLGTLMAFHRDYKYVLMAHNQREYRSLGRLLATAKSELSLKALRNQYLERFMKAIQRPASRGNHINAMLHLLGYLKRSVPSAVRTDIINVIEQYRRGEVNLATPLTLLRHYLQLFGSRYVQAQYYLQPYPASLGLSNQL